MAVDAKGLADRDRCDSGTPSRLGANRGKPPAVVRLLSWLTQPVSRFRNENSGNKSRCFHPKEAWAYLVVSAATAASFLTNSFLATCLTFLAVAFSAFLTIGFSATTAAAGAAAAAGATAAGAAAAGAAAAGAAALAAKTVKEEMRAMSSLFMDNSRRV